MSASAQLGGVILCGGKSSRMGHSKARLPFGSETMLERVVRLLRQVATPIVVVGEYGSDREIDDEGVLWTVDERPDQGPLEGILAGLRELKKHGSCQAAYVTSCDVPLLQPAFVSALQARLAGQSAAVPKEDRFYHPLSAAYRLEVIPTIEQLLRDDQRRPAFLFQRVATHEVPVDKLREVDPELDTLRNLNHPEDYFAALQRAVIEVTEDVRRLLIG